MSKQSDTQHASADSSQSSIVNSQLDMHTPDFTDANIAKIAELFPGCVTEARDDTSGGVKRAIDFDQLRQELSDHIVEGPRERYHLNWPGKREALLAANARIAKTLRPCREESVDFDRTKNLFIEGDNLDALKLLQETYLNKVKMIYIDPPYNTGRDFVYADTFCQNSLEYLRSSLQINPDGDRLVANPESFGRYHSAWLSMIFPRLKVARHLLADDGLICISIDENEQANLHRICDELYGEQNHVATIAVTHNPKGRSDDKYIARAHEYLVVYKRSEAVMYGWAPGEHVTSRYRQNEPDGRRYREIDLRKTGDNDRRADRPNLFYAFLYDETTGELTPTRGEDAPTGVIRITPTRQDGTDGNWRWELATAQQRIDVLIAKYMPVRKKWSVFEKDYLTEEKRVKPTTSWTDKRYNSERGPEQLIACGFSKETFPSPKPLGLLADVLSMSTGPSDIVLDFFSGSAGMAEAVLRQNLNDGGCRTFLMVQIAEACNEESAAWAEGFASIAEIGKERIRRAGKKIKEEAGLNAEKLDTGFRVLKIDSSNMKDVYYQPDETTRELLSGLVENIKGDRSDEDLLFQVLLDWGVDLSLPIRREEWGIVNGEWRMWNGENGTDSEPSPFDIHHSTFSVWFVDGNALAACFETGLNEDFVKELAKREPRRAVFRDAGYGSDDVKINVEQIFKQFSPGTEVKTL